MVGKNKITEAGIEVVNLECWISVLELGGEDVSQDNIETAWYVDVTSVRLFFVSPFSFFRDFMKTLEYDLFARIEGLGQSMKLFKFFRFSMKSMMRGQKGIH